MVAALQEKGWAVFPYEDAVADWARRAKAVADSRVQDPEEQRLWLQCEGTWFVGVGTLHNDARGAVADSGALSGDALATANALYGQLPLHAGQVSVIYPGYPRPRQGEGDAAFRYRQKRDAAHVDGLLAIGDDRRRMLRERHAYVLGLPLTRCSATASPLVVWEGSHKIMRAAFEAILGGISEAQWADTDLTDIYQAARRQVFETCPRVPVPAVPGQAYLVHRHALHGVAPWDASAQASEQGRMIAYFRPEFANRGTDWLDAP